MENLNVWSVLLLALAGGLAGAVGWSIRQVPAALVALLRHATVSTLDIKQPELIPLLDRVLLERSGQRRQQIDRVTPRGQRAPANGWHFLRYQRRWIVVRRQLANAGSKGDNFADFVPLPQITLWCLGGFAPLDAVLQAAERLEAEDHAARARSSYYIRLWDSWERHPAHHSGGMQHVILPVGMAEDIISAGEAFFASEHWYRSVGVNWAQGWLFSGPPGTGKSRTAWGIAQHLGAKLYILDLSRPGTSNADVHRLVRRMDPRSVMLLDDLDKHLEMLRTQGQKEGASQVTFAGILAALELPGAAGRLTIITANDESLLNADGTGALLRSGRVDRKWRFGPATAEQARRLVAHFNGHVHNERWVADQEGQPPAEICAELLRLRQPGH